MIKMRYELELIRIYHPKDEPDYETRRTERTISTGIDKGELMRQLKRYKLKKGKTFSEDIALLELDEYGDIVDYLYIRSSLEE